ncbi:MAG: TatD family hydrolase [Rhodanobacteraceae bacterium]
MNANRPPELIDSHCHIDLPAFDQDRAEVLKRARAKGVVSMVIAGVSAARWESLCRVTSDHPGLYPAYGLHPMFMGEHKLGDVERLDDFLNKHQSVAVGECGLDFYHGRDDANAQKQLLHAQLEIARKRDLPVILHARKALQEVTQLLKNVGGLRGVVHSFSGSPEQARQLWELGFHLGIGGVATYPRARRLRRIVAEMPCEWLLLETDSPDQPLHGHQGQRNEPARLPEVLACVAQLRNEDPVVLAAQTRSNTSQLFNLGLDM